MQRKHRKMLRGTWCELVVIRVWAGTASPGSHLLHPEFPSTQNILFLGISHTHHTSGSQQDRDVTALGARMEPALEFRCLQQCGNIWLCRALLPAREVLCAPWELLLFPVSVPHCTCGCSQVCSLPCAAPVASLDRC